MRGAWHRLGEAAEARRSTENLRLSADLGADAMVNVSEVVGVATAVREVTAGRGERPCRMTHGQYHDLGILLRCYPRQR